MHKKGSDFFTRKHPQQGENTLILKLLKTFTCPSIEQTTKTLIETLTDSNQNIQPSERAWPKTCSVWYLDSEGHIFHMLRVMVEYVPQKFPSIWNCRNALRRFQKKCCKQLFYIRNKGLAIGYCFLKRLHILYQKVVSVWFLKTNPAGGIKLIWVKKNSNSFI